MLKRNVSRLIVVMIAALISFAGCGGHGGAHQNAPAPGWTLDIGAVYVPLALSPTGVVYALTNSGDLKAIGSGGSVLWSQPVNSPDRSYGVAPAVSGDGMIYILSPRYFALFGQDGTMLKSWRLNTNEGIAYGIALDRQRLYFQCAIVTVCSWSLGPLWQPQWSIVQMAGRAAPMIHRDGHVVWGGDLIVKLDGSSRVTDWFYPDTAHFVPFSRSPNEVDIRGGAAMHVIGLAAAPDGRTIATMPTGVLALSSAGKKIWEIQDPVAEIQPIVAADGTVYYVEKKGDLVALSPEGKKLWTFVGVGQPGAPLLGASGTIYYPVGEKIHAINPSGDEKWAAPVDSSVWGSMTLNRDGTLYAATQQGKLYAFPVGEPLMPSPWPKFQGNTRNSGEEGVD